MSLDPMVAHYVGVPAPYRLKDAAFFVERMAIADWNSRQRVLRHAKTHS